MNVTTEQREQVAKQLERAENARVLKENHIRLKRVRAELFRSLATEIKADPGYIPEGGPEDAVPLQALLSESDADMCDNDAALLELDYAEYLLALDVMRQQVRAIESGLHLPVMPGAGAGKNRR